MSDVPSEIFNNNGKMRSRSSLSGGSRLPPSEITENTSQQPKIQFLFVPNKQCKMQYLHEMHLWKPWKHHLSASSFEL